MLFDNSVDFGAEKIIFTVSLEKTTDLGSSGPSRALAPVFLQKRSPNAKQTAQSDRQTLQGKQTTQTTGRRRLLIKRIFKGSMGRESHLISLVSAAWLFFTHTHPTLPPPPQARPGGHATGGRDDRHIDLFINQPRCLSAIAFTLA